MNGSVGGGASGELERLFEIVPPRLDKAGKVIVAVDVQNKLLGTRGATRIYGPQKGLRPEDFGLAESCLRKLACAQRRSQNAATVSGSGAAGGLGFGLLAFADAKLEPGFDLFVRHTKLAR